MEQKPLPHEPYTATASASSAPQKRGGGCFPATVFILILVAVAWFLVRPGVFTVQPIGALPEGVTFIYHSRNPEMPLFSSPDGLCLKLQNSVSLLCRGAALGGVGELTERIVIRLPYSQWAYLQSTGGREFEK